MKKKMVKNSGMSVRKVAKAVGVSYGSVRNILHNNLQVKPYHKYRVQKLSKEQKNQGVQK